MLEKDFNEVYTKFKLHFYRAVFGRFKRREATLTTVETFCMEIILALGEPTVNEFSNFVGISPQRGLQDQQPGPEGVCRKAAVPGG